MWTVAGAFLAGAAQALPPPPVVISEPAVIGARPPLIRPAAPQVLVGSYGAPPRAVMCREGEARVLAAEHFAPRTEVRYVPPPPQPGRPVFVPPVSGPPTSATPPLEFAFNVSGEGRVTGLRRVEPATPYVAGHDEAKLQANLVTWRFAAAPRTDCRLRVTTAFTRLEETDRRTLFHAVASGAAGEARRQINERVNPSGNCYRGRRPRIRVRVYPDWERVPLAPGRKAWVAFDYDIDPQGAAHNVRVVDSSGQGAVDAAATEAVSGFRFASGPRTGCRHYFWPASEAVLAAPPVDLTGADRPGDDQDCPRDLLTFGPDRPYPPAFRERSVEGWAVLRFSVAPWGEIGAIEVVRSEPSEMFGRTAADMLRRARANTGGRAYQGCSVPIAFRIGDQADAPTALDDVP
jgi:TonB family protein